MIALDQEAAAAFVLLAEAEVAADPVGVVGALDPAALALEGELGRFGRRGKAPRAPIRASVLTPLSAAMVVWMVMVFPFRVDGFGLVVVEVVVGWVGAPRDAAPLGEVLALAQEQQVDGVQRTQWEVPVLRPGAGRRHRRGRVSPPAAEADRKREGHRCGPVLTVGLTPGRGR
ncbi:MAG: hypothetical protein R3D59_10520 [Paracoccaceae bacterium]